MSDGLGVQRRGGRRGGEDAVGQVLGGAVSARGGEELEEGVALVAFTRHPVCQRVRDSAERKLAADVSKTCRCPENDDDARSFRKSSPGDSAYIRRRCRRWPWTSREGSTFGKRPYSRKRNCVCLSDVADPWRDGRLLGDVGEHVEKLFLGVHSARRGESLDRNASLK